ARDGRLNCVLARNGLLAPCNRPVKEEEGSRREDRSHQEIYASPRRRDGWGKAYSTAPPHPPLPPLPMRGSEQLLRALLLRRLLFLRFLDRFLLLGLGRFVLLGDDGTIDGVNVYFVNAGLS